MRYLIGDGGTAFTRVFDGVVSGEGVEVVTGAVRMPRRNSFIGWWVLACRRGLLDRILIWDRAHLFDALRVFEAFCTAGIGLIGSWAAWRYCGRDRSGSLIPVGWITSTSGGKIDWAASFTTMHIPPDLHG